MKMVEDIEDKVEENHQQQQQQQLKRSTASARRCVECRIVDDCKYKCPACFQPYCSVACCRLHKGSDSCLLRQQQNLAEKLLSTQLKNDNDESHIIDNSSSNNVNKTNDNDDIEEEFKLSSQQLASLDSSDELQQLFEKDEQLRGLLTSIAKFSKQKQSKQNINREIRSAMNSNASFLNFVDTCLTVVEPKQLSHVVEKFSNQK